MWRLKAHMKINYVSFARPRFRWLDYTNVLCVVNDDDDAAAATTAVVRVIVFVNHLISSIDWHQSTNHTHKHTSHHLEAMWVILMWHHNETPQMHILVDDSR